MSSSYPAYQPQPQHAVKYMAQPPLPAAAPAAVLAQARQLNYPDPNRVTMDVERATRVFPTLKTQVDTLTDNTGRSQRMLQLDGLVPITYNGVAYNIPYCIWVDLGYPNRPPQCYVKPVQGMSIVPGHRHVGSDGMCYFPYLHGWNAHTHNLADFVGVMQQVFGLAPPVVAGAAPIHTQPAPNVRTLSGGTGQPLNLTAVGCLQ